MDQVIFKKNADLWIQPRIEPYISLNEDITFNLGGLTILPSHVPGHSPGNMVFIIPEERIAIFGDAISHPTLIVFDNSPSIQEHYDALVKLQDYSHLYDRILVNHETFELDKIVLENNTALAKSILEGTDEKYTTSNRSQKLGRDGLTVYAARTRQPWLPSNPKDIGNIYYREDKV